MIYETEPQSNQEVFDRVWKTFVTEGKPRATANGTCVYRVPPGVDGEEHGCAIGCQLPTTLYSPSMEHKAVFQLLGLSSIDVIPQEKQRGIRYHFRYVAAQLLHDLQIAHDSEAVHTLDVRLRGVAATWNLTVPA